MLATSARTALLLSAWPLAAACQQHATPRRGLSERYDFSTPVARFELPGRLDEVSGLAVTPDGRLFGHDDERATVHHIDPVTGEVGKRFSLGDPPLRADFEAIAIVGERFFLVTSTGILHEFREAADREQAPYRTTDTGLGTSCEVEGLDYDPTDDVLLVACKTSIPERAAIVIHRLPLDPTRGALSPIEVDRGQLSRHGVAEHFAPSSIAADPAGTLVLVSAVVEALVEIDRDGAVLSAVRLVRRVHRQPEGLAFGLDGSLIIADERNQGDARVTTYARRPLEVDR